MNAKIKWMAVLALTIVLRIGPAAAAEDSSTKPIQQMMDRNFQAVARVLSDLIDGRYSSIPLQAQIMIQHASQLIDSPPIRLQSASDRIVFLAYATNLRLAASELQSVTESMAKRDHLRSSPAELSWDSLRSAASRQLGEIVTSCAMCHSQFRP